MENCRGAQFITKGGLWWSPDDGWGTAGQNKCRDCLAKAAELGYAAAICRVAQTWAWFEALYAMV